MDKYRQTAILMQKGFALLAEHRYQEALKMGHRLKKLRHSSAFEILALAFLHLGKLPKAISVLEEGVAKAGRAWILWELLGNCYSDAGRYSKAETTYRQALQKEKCNRDVIHLNRAIAFDRAGKHAEAMNALRFVRLPRLQRRADACRIRTRLELGKIRAARQLAFRLSRCRPTSGENYDKAAESEILLSCALGLGRDEKTKARSERLAFRAVDARPHNAEALALIREIRHRKAPHLHLSKLIIHGVWNTPIGNSSVPPGFYRTVEAAAANEDAAFKLARRFFPKAVRQSLSVEEVQPLDRTSIGLEGVYFLSSYFFYPRRRRK